MKLKLSTLAATCGFAVAGMGGQANALTIAADGIPQVILRVSGASAISRSFGEVVNQQLCQPNTNTVYWNDQPVLGTLTSADGTRYQAYYCSAKAGITGIAAGARLLVVKRDRDGSFLGVGPVINTQAIEFMRVDNTCTDLGAGVLYPNPRFLCAATENAIPAGGLSDVEVALWAARGQFTQTVPGTFTEIKGAFGQGFGLGVSTKLYQGLQTEQGLTPGAMDAANQPSVSREQYTSIVSTTGGYVNASFLTGVAGKLNNCRRVSTSGTQATSDAYFVENPCKKNADPTFGQLLPRPAANYGPNLTVIENSGTGDVINCLSQDATGGTVLDAIGVVSLENTPSGNWSFVKVDGVSPNFFQGLADPTHRLNVVNGFYLAAVEGSMQWRNDNAFAGATGALQLVANGLTNPALVNLTGIYSVRRPPAVTNTLFPDRVHKGTRFGNSCQAFQLFE